MQKKTIWDMGRVSLEAFRTMDKMPVVVVLDNIRSLNNIGSVFRTSDGFAAAGIALCGISAVPPSPEIHKTALGAEDSVEWRYFASTAEAVECLRSEGFCIVCLEQVKGSIGLESFRPDTGKKYALVAGNEVDGVGQDIVDMADFCLEIPQSGTKHSLNVAVSTALALWEFYKAYMS
ncbi:MAG: TrmH family RNA methyltransferase [Muribaculaceae bacterium]|nr:TrmH family RNA methyltransferase [Muribaculaceae bacterium]